MSKCWTWGSHRCGYELSYLQIYDFKVTWRYVPENWTPWYVTTSLQYTNTVLNNFEDVYVMLINLFPTSLPFRIVSHFHAMSLVTDTPCNLNFIASYSLLSIKFVGTSHKAVLPQVPVCESPAGRFPQVKRI
jgi:hypothetical protein